MIRHREDVPWMHHGFSWRLLPEVIAGDRQEMRRMRKEIASLRDEVRRLHGDIAPLGVPAHMLLPEWKCTRHGMTHYLRAVNEREARELFRRHHGEDDLWPLYVVLHRAPEPV